jgi:hypothetical protein
MKYTRIVKGVSIIGAACIACLGQAPTVNPEQRVAALEKRIAELENRLVLIENRLNLVNTPPAKATAVQSSAELLLPIRVRLFQKKFIAGASPSEDDKLAFLLEFQNDDSREIILLQGMVLIKDLPGNVLLSFDVAVRETIPPGGKRTWYGGIPYLENDPKVKTVRFMPDQEVYVSMKPNKVGYADGSVREAGK